MITQLHIQNYKALRDLSLDLTPIQVATHARVDEAPERDVVGTHHGGERTRVIRHQGERPPDVRNQRRVAVETLFRPRGVLWVYRRHPAGSGLRNAMRAELGFGSELKLDRSLAWIGTLHQVTD